MEVERKKEGLKDLSMQEESKSIQELLKERILTSNPLEAHQHCEVTIGKNNNNNGKRNP
jgi:hypothetical protein